MVNEKILVILDKSWNLHSDKITHGYWLVIDWLMLQITAASWEVNTGYNMKQQCLMSVHSLLLQPLQMKTLCRGVVPILLLPVIMNAHNVHLATATPRQKVTWSMFLWCDISDAFYNICGVWKQFKVANTNGSFSVNWLSLYIKWWRNKIYFLYLFCCYSLP